MNPILMSMIVRKREEEERNEGRDYQRGSGRRSSSGRFTRDRAIGQSQGSRGSSQGGGQGRGQDGARGYDNRMQNRDNADMARGGQGGYGDRQGQDGRQGVRSTGRYGIGGSRYSSSRDRAMEAQGEFAYQNNDFNYDGRHNEEHNEYDQMGLNRSEFKKWSNMLKNADGTRGPMYDMNQVMPIADQMGIDFRKFNEDDLLMSVNAMYSDYCNLFGNDLHKYVALAKAFLEDDDFEGSGSEKLALYYHCIANKED